MRVELGERLLMNYDNSELAIISSSGNQCVESRPITDALARNQNIERILDTVVSNGLKAGWVSLGHQEGVGDVLPLVTVQRQTTGTGGETSGSNHTARLTSAWDATDRPTVQVEPQIDSDAT